MSLTKELIEQERHQVQSGSLRDVHLHREGSFLRAYDWSAWLCCRYLHDFKVNKRTFKGIDEAVANIGLLCICYQAKNAVCSKQENAEILSCWFLRMHTP